MSDLSCWDNVSGIKDFGRLQYLGAGAFGRVYRAVCRKNEKEVAVKLINKEEMKEKKMLDRVVSEVRIHSRLDHPSIVKLYKFFEDETNVYLVLELCENGELQSYMKDKRKGKPFSEEEAKDILQQVVDGLIYLQSQKVIHRDLKLSNILLTKDMRIKIADFGLSAVANNPHRTVCGTPNFMSPEVATGSTHGLQADVFSLGCLLYTLLVGRPPFDSPTAICTITRSISSDPKIPSNISAEARDLIQAMLKKSPEERITLQKVMEHSFLRNSVTNRSKPSIHRSVDSGLDSSGLPSWAESYNSRCTQSGSDRRSRFSQFDSGLPFSKYSQASSKQTSKDEDILPSRDENLLPRFGKSPPVRLMSNDKTHKSGSMNNLRAKLQTLPPPPVRPTDFYDAMDFMSNKYPQNAGTRGQEQDISECVQLQRPREPSVNPHIRDEDFQMSECNPLVDRYQYGNNDGSNHSGQLNCQNYSMNPQSSCHGSELDHGACCSQCTETHKCGRDHCRQQTCNLSFCPKQLNHCRNRSPSPKCCRHNVRDGDGCGLCSSHPSCSHYGHCDVLRCTHADVCHCRITSQKNIRSTECEIKTHQMPASTHANTKDHVEAIHREVNEFQISAAAAQPEKNLPKRLNTQRLRPVRREKPDNVAHILPGGEVCIEQVQQHKGKRKVTWVYRISNDGQRILSYLAGRRGTILGMEPPPIPEKGADVVFSYESLNDKNFAKQRKVYEWAVMFVQNEKARTVKLTYYTPFGKCVIMESGDFIVVFNEGGRVTAEAKDPAILKIVGPNGEEIDLMRDDDISHLETNLRQMVKNFLTFEKVCKNHEQSIERDREVTGLLSLDPFPTTIGRPAKPSSGTSKRDNKENLSAAGSICVQSVSNVVPFSNALLSHTNSPPELSTARPNIQSHQRISGTKTSGSITSSSRSEQIRSSSPRTSSQAIIDRILNTKYLPSETNLYGSSAVNHSSPYRSSELSAQKYDIYKGSNMKTSSSNGAYTKSESLRSYQSQSSVNNKYEKLTAEVPGVGLVSKYSTGDTYIKIQYNDGTQLRLVKGSDDVYFTEKYGSEKRYPPDSARPPTLHEKLNQLHPIMKDFQKAIRSRSEMRQALREVPCGNY